MVWENIEEIKKIFYINYPKLTIFFVCNFFSQIKCWGAFFFPREILPEQNFLID